MPYTEKEAKELVIQAGLKLKEAGLIARTWGNISARISDTRFVITPSGLLYESLTPDEIVTVAIDDGSYEGDIKPSSEKGVHASVYQLRPEVDFVIHTHQEAATIVSLPGVSIAEYGKSGAKARKILGEEIPCASYGMPSTKELQEAVKKVVRDYPNSNAALMRFHGTVCMGRNAKEAFEVSTMLEKVCEAKITKVINLNENNDILHEQITEEWLSEEEKDKICHQNKTMYIRQVTDPEIVAVSRLGKTMNPNMDDLAQIAGETIKCVKAEDAAEGILNRNAVLIKGKGAIITAGEEEDLKALQMILKKSCRAFLYCLALGKNYALPDEEAGKLRKFYVETYAKLSKKFTKPIDIV